MNLTYMNMKFEMIEFTETEKIFLTNFRPKDRHFTSWDEADKIINVMNLKNRLDSLRAVRNSVVDFYSGKIHDDPDRERQFDLWMPAMQSVTAVIDHIMYNSCRYEDL